MPQYTYSKLLDAMYPTFPDTRRAIKRADKIGPARDTRDMMAILTRISEASPRIMGDSDTRRTALTSFNWSLTPKEKTDIDRAAMATARLRKATNILMPRWLDTFLLGAFLHELDWVDMGDGRGQKRPEIMHRYLPTEIERNGADTSKLQLLADDMRLVRTSITTKPENVMLAAVDSFYQTGGLLRTMMYYDLMRNTVMQEWMQFNVKLKGVVLAQYEEWASKEDKQIAVQTMENLSTQQFGMTSKAVNFTFQDVVNAMACASFRDFVNLIEDSCSIIVLGQANTTKLPDQGGSRAALQILNLIRADKLYTDIIGFSGLINDQLLLYDARINLSPTLTESPFTFSLNLAEDEDAEKNMRVISDGLAVGMQFLSEEVFRKIQMTKPDGMPDVIAPLAKTGPPVF